MIETPIEVHPSNGEVVDWKDNPPFTFRLKGDNISYIYCQIYNLLTNEIRLEKRKDCFYSYNNEEVSISSPLVTSNATYSDFDEKDYGKDYKYRYLIGQQNPYTTNLKKDGSYGLYTIDKTQLEPNYSSGIKGFYLKNVPKNIFSTLIELVSNSSDNSSNSESHTFPDKKTITQKVITFLARFNYGNAYVLKHISSFSCEDKYIKLEETMSITEYEKYESISLYVCINSPNPSIYVGRSSLASKPMGTKVSWVLLDTSLVNYNPRYGWTGTQVQNGYNCWGTYYGMYIKIGDEMRRITDYKVSYDSTADNTQYWLSFQPPLPKDPSVNTPVEFYTNYIVTPWYDFKCRHTPTAELTVARNPDTGFLKCTSSYSQLDGISLKSYNFSVFNNSRSKCVATTNNQYSYRQEWEFPLPTITGNYTVDALLTSQDNDTVGISKKISSGKYFLKNISTIETNDEDHSIRVDWSENDFTSGLGDVGEYYNVYRKIDDGKKNIKASDDFVFIGTTQSLGITDYTAGNNQSYCYQVENSGENNIHTLLDLTFAEQSFNSEPQTNTPFASENYSYTSSISSTTGVYSNPFVMPNGKYHINVISQSKPSNMELVIYNPYYGCYGYGDNGYVDLDWEKIDDNYYVCDFEIKTDYQQNYVMLGDPSKNMGRWSALDIQLYQITPYTYLYTDPITTNWDGWSISALTQIKDFHGLHQYEIGDTWRFYAELNEPTITMQNDFQVHNGTAQYGQISRGNNNYDSGTFTSNIIEMECPDKIIYDDIDKIQKWKKFIYDNEAFLLKSSKGDVWIVGITDSPTRQYEQGMNEPTIVSYNWVEIDDVRKAIIVD